MSLWVGWDGWCGVRSGLLVAGVWGFLEPGRGVGVNGDGDGGSERPAGRAGRGGFCCRVSGGPGR